MQLQRTFKPTSQIDKLDQSSSVGYFSLGRLKRTKSMLRL